MALFSNKTDRRAKNERKVAAQKLIIVTLKEKYNTRYKSEFGEEVLDMLEDELEKFEQQFDEADKNFEFPFFLDNLENKIEDAADEWIRKMSIDNLYKDIVDELRDEDYSYAEASEMIEYLRGNIDLFMENFNKSVYAMEEDDLAEEMAMWLIRVFR